MPGLDEKRLDQDGDQEDRDKDRADFVRQFLKEVGKAEVELHCRLPLVIDSAPSSKLTTTSNLHLKRVQQTLSAGLHATKRSGSPSMSARPN
jgi:hypothetical protein